MKGFIWITLLPLFLGFNSGLDLGAERIYVGFQSVKNSDAICKLVMQVRVSNAGDVQSPAAEMEFFASPVREDPSWPARKQLEIPSLAPGESVELANEWRVDKFQADQMCKELCCGMMLVKAQLDPQGKLDDGNARNNTVMSVLVGKSPENASEITSLDSVFVKMKPEDKEAILLHLEEYSQTILRMIKAGNAGCWVNQENGYTSIVHLNK